MLKISGVKFQKGKDSLYLRNLKGPSNSLNKPIWLNFMLTKRVPFAIIKHKLPFLL